ncbi:MAG: hypothetical protein ACXWDO_02835 [Bacteroidia bacterium]
MKKPFIFLFFLLCIEAFFSTGIYACDGCGPSSGCKYVGVLPNFRKNFVGIRWNDRAFETSPYEINSNELSKRTKDRYFSAEIWGRYFVTPKLQLIGLLPYAYHTRKEGEKLNTIQGLGDAVLLSNYMIYATPDSLEKAWTHVVQLGGGVKLPTGKYNHADNGHVYHANFQLGSGSTDLLANAIYTLRYNKFGFRTDVGYKYNTTNASNYRFGNRISNNNSLFYWGAFDGDNAVVPQIGLYQEFAARDVSNGFFERNTGGTTRLLTFATDVYYSRFSLGVNYMMPLQQPDYDYPTFMKHSFRLNLNYFL